MAYELAPTTPPEGRLLTDKFQPSEIAGMFAHLRQRGTRYGMVFNDAERASNSRLSLLAGEFAKDAGRYDQFHENVFKAFFTDLKDIGQIDELLEIAANSGLDAEELRQALAENRHQERLDTAKAEAGRLGINAIPAFLFENDQVISGALPPEVFRNTIKEIHDGTFTKPLM